MLVEKLTKEKELLSLSVNSAGNYASVGLLSSSNKCMIYSFGLTASNSSQRQQIDLKLPSTLDKKANDCPIQWGMHQDTEELLAVGANQKLELWNFGGSVPQPLSLTQGHLLAIRDINWSCNPNLLGSCSYDSSVLIWDTRDNTQPSVRIKTLAGASCIKFNREKYDVIALAHEDIVTIWDIRFVNRYLAFLDLPAKVLNFDWHPKIPQVLSTASKDGYIRMWNYERHGVDPQPLAEKSHKQNGVSRVKFTPCGRGLVSCSTVITQKSPSITLWNFRESSGGGWQIDNAGFVGNNNEQLVGMEWSLASDDYKLCTISKSKEIRLYDVDLRSFSAMENPEGKALGKRRPFLSGAAGDPFKSTESFEPTSIQEEIELIKKYIGQNDRMEFQTIGQHRYSIKLRSSDSKNVIECVISLPPLYPRACEPNFEIYTSHGLIEVSVKSELIQTLTSTAAHYVSHNKFCLRYCIDTLYSSFQKLSLENNTYQDLNELYTHAKITHAPIRARFAANDTLVYFYLSRPLAKSSRALTDVTLRLSEQLHHTLSQPTQPARRADTPSFVALCDLSSLTRLDCGLARDTLFYSCDPLVACHHNRLLAAAHGRADLVQVWHLLLQLLGIRTESYSLCLQFMAGEVAYRAMEYYLSVKDVQAVATIFSFISAYNKTVERKRRLIFNESKLNEQISYYITVYSEVLSRWGLLNTKCRVLKCMPQDETRGIALTDTIKHALENGSICVICHYLVQGMVAACPQCGHGGHLYHLREWFLSSGECPTGCGCNCENYINENTIFI